jgi:hypothetical protein
MNVDDHGRIAADGDRQPEPVTDIVFRAEPFAGWIRVSLIADGVVRFQGPTSVQRLRQVIHEFEWAAGECEDKTYAERFPAPRSPGGKGE